MVKSLTSYVSFRSHDISNSYRDLVKDDDGFILYESRAICHYIALKYADQGTPLLPVGLKANAFYQQAVFAEVSHFDEHANKALREKLVEKYVFSTITLTYARPHIYPDYRFFPQVPRPSCRLSGV